jgi:hypothetical protein
MRQLQLFTSAELGRMRDRTASRNYSPEKDEFRREHERHRAWGQCHVAYFDLGGCSAWWGDIVPGAGLACWLCLRVWWIGRW